MINIFIENLDIIIYCDEKTLQGKKLTSDRVLFFYLKWCLFFKKLVYRQEQKGL